MYRLDPDITRAMTTPTGAAPPPTPGGGDVEGLRRLNTFFYNQWRTSRPPFLAGYPTVTAERGSIPHGVRSTPYRWYTRTDPTSGPAVLYIHGGAQIMGTLDQYEGVIADYVAATGIPFLAIDYQLAPEATGMSQPEEGLNALRWLHHHAAALGIDTARIAVMGDSAGAGIAVGVTELARHDDLTPALGVFIYPMLDDRTITVPAGIADLVNFRPEDNHTGWQARLGPRYGTDDVNPAQAPARITDLTGFPDTYLEVGELDLFRNETLTFTNRFITAEVPTEFHLWPGANHGFDLFAPHIDLTQRAFTHRAAALSRL